MNERYEVYGLQFIGKTVEFQALENKRIAQIVETLIIPGVKAVCHGNTVWVLFSETIDSLDITKMLVTLTTELTLIFLSRIRMFAYIHELDILTPLEKMIASKASYLYKELYTQRSIFDTQEPTIDQMREDLRTGLWIT